MTTTIENPQKLELLSDTAFEEKRGISQTAYAKHRGVERQAIHKHIKNGILTRGGGLLPNGKIDKEAADIELAEKLDPAHTGNADEQKGANKGTVSNAPASPQAGKGADSNTLNFNRVKTLEKGYDVKIKELSYKKLTGELVDRVKTKNAYSSKITAVARRLQKIAKRISPAVAKESDRIKCENMILNEIKEAVEEFGQHGTKQA